MSQRARAFRGQLAIVLALTVAFGCNGRGKVTEPPDQELYLNLYVSPQSPLVIPARVTLRWESNCSEVRDWLGRSASPNGLKDTTITTSGEHVFTVACLKNGQILLSKSATRTAVYAPEASLSGVGSTNVYVGESFTFQWECKYSLPLERSWVQTAGGVSTATKGTGTLSWETAGQYRISLICEGEGGLSEAEIIVSVRLRPVIRGVLHGFFEGSGWTSPSRVYVIGEKRTDWTNTKPDGTFSVETSAPVDSPPWDECVNIVIDELGTGNKFVPSFARVCGEERNMIQGFVQHPRVWTVQNGDFKGFVSVVDFESSVRYAPPTLLQPQNFGFFPRLWAFSSAWLYNVYGHIPRERMPMPVAIDRARSHADIDSVFAWSASDKAERKRGVKIFRPVNFSDLSPNEGIRLRVDTTALAKHASIWVDSEGTIVGGEVVFTQAYPIPGWGDLEMLEATIIHELWGHLTGHGHTCEWDSVMWSNCSNGANRIRMLTERDVAGMEYYEASWEACRRTNAKYCLPEAHQGQRWQRGLPTEQVWKWPPANMGMSALINSAAIRVITIVEPQKK